MNWGALGILFKYNKEHWVPNSLSSFGKVWHLQGLKAGLKKLIKVDLSQPLSKLAKKIMLTQELSELKDVQSFNYLKNKGGHVASDGRIILPHFTKAGLKINKAEY